MYTVLLVDDDDAEHYLCQQVLRRSGLDVKLLIAFDGIEALEKIAASDESIDLILLDINMPRMNGHEFLEHYQRDATVPTPVVAVLTSSDQERDRQQMLRYEFVHDYLLKPLGKDDACKLAAIIDQIRDSEK